jgi:hypothetical protein
MPFLEEFIADRNNPVVKAGLNLELEYTIKDREPMADGTAKSEVRHSKAGCVCVGTHAECVSYIRQQRSKQAVKAAERGTNPFFTK